MVPPPNIENALERKSTVKKRVSDMYCITSLSVRLLQLYRVVVIRVVILLVGILDDFA